MDLEDFRCEITRDQCTCGYKGLSSKARKIHHWGPHEGGYTVDGFDSKQWLYIYCPLCGYQWALWKLGVKIR